MNKNWIKKWVTLRHLKRIRKINYQSFRGRGVVQKGLKIVAGFIVLVLLWFFLWFLPHLPDVGDLSNLTAAQASEILDREGNLLYRIHGDENRETVPFDEISPFAGKAVVSIEDDQFYEHSGIDIPGIMKAVCAEFGLCPARGGSTITQQFIKNAFLSPERTYSRKLKEMILALQLEGKFTKDQILGMYLNRIPYGSNIYGIERASNVFFGKTAKDLTIAESAILASIPKAPTFYSPYGNNRYATTIIESEQVFKRGIETEKDIVDYNPQLISKGLLGKAYVFEQGEEKKEIYLKGRADFVLSRMQSLGHITDDQYKKAIEEIKTIEFNEFKEDIIAPHFVMFVRQYLEQKYGKDQVEQGGLRVITTIDPKMQAAAKEAVDTFAEQNLKRYDASNASLVAMDPDNGHIMAMIGSADFWNDEIDGKVNVALRPRLPGSSFKPIVYAAAFLQGYAPSTVLYDVKTKFGAWYEPENYDGEYRGPVTMRKALAHSLNVPAVKAGYLAGIPNVLDLARKMGIQLNQPDDWYGLSLALGAGEARLIDMVQSYGVFASGGYKMEPVSILKIEDRNGNILEEYSLPKDKELILDPQAAYLVNESLSDVESRPEGWWRQQLSIPGQVNAAKTGTSNKKIDEENFPFDTWTIGYTRRLVAGVWAGNNSGKHLSLKASGLDTAGRIWNRFMTKATKGLPSEPFDKPEEIKFVNVSQKTGLLPSEFTPEEEIKTEVFASFSVPTDLDEAYKVVEIDKVSEKLATEYTPEGAIEERAFFEHHSILKTNANWEEAVRLWAEENNQDEKVPTEYDDVHTLETMNEKPEMVIKSPVDMSVVSPPSVGVLVDIQSLAGVEKVDYYFDGELLYTADQAPYRGKIDLPEGVKKGESYVIKAVVFDKFYRSNQSSVQVRIGDDTGKPNVSFSYPGDGVKLPVSSLMLVEADAWDREGGVEKVEFYWEGQLSHTSKKAPYVWPLFTDAKTGDYRLKVIAYDFAGNQSSDSILITLKKENKTYSESSILRPKANRSSKVGEPLLIEVGLADVVRNNIAEISVQARQKKGRPIEVASWENTEGKKVASTHYFTWSLPPAGVYELALRIELKDGRKQYSKRIPIVIR